MTLQVYIHWHATTDQLIIYREAKWSSLKFAYFTLFFTIFTIFAYIPVFSHAFAINDYIAQLLNKTLNYSVQRWYSLGMCWMASNCVTSEHQLRPVLRVPIPIFHTWLHSTIQAAPLRTYISAWLIQVSGHIRLIDQHRHRPRIRAFVDRRRITSTGQFLWQ